MAYFALQTDLTPRQKNYISNMNSSAGHLLSIINDVLDISKIGAGKLELEQSVFYLKEMEAHLASMFTEKVSSKDITLTFDFDGIGDYKLIGDEIRLEQILINLISNAIKFTDSDGKVAVRCRLEYENEVACTIKIEVEDSGIGMTQEQIKLLFQSFQQADNSITRKYGGTGLGLSICKKLITMMGGDIGVSSDYGKGSTFWFTVSLDKCKATTKDIQITNNDTDYCLTGKRILLVEDNEFNQQVALDMLEIEGMIAKVANNGVEAVLAMTKEDNDYAGILMDIQMPEMDGLSATKNIRALGHTDIPIIALTANASLDDREKCFNAGMNDFITKPYKPEKLYSVLNKWIG
ncbi:MAG: ATP-binding protein [Gammaproteobacteria bacterium]|nr:ATP-binding protein [Gammaproteobacteria bacterium]